MALIRSPGMNGESNIDILFGDVSYIELPSDLFDLRIEEAAEEDVLYLEEKFGKNIERDNITVLVSDEKKYYIVASLTKVMENDLSFDELPFDRGIS